jgi:hypothetical protein
MNRLALLVASLALVACSGRSPWAGGSAKSVYPEAPRATAPVAETPAAEGEAAPAAPRYSWDKQKEAEAAPSSQLATGAPEDVSKCRIVALRPEHGLIAIALREKPADGTTLQLTKGDKAVLIRVIRSDDNSTIADILSGQDLSKMPTFELLEEVLCGAPADLPIQ